MKMSLAPAISVLALALVISSSSATSARQQKQQQQSPQPSSSIQTMTLAPAEIQRIIKAFTAKETEFRKALNQYSFKRDATIQTIGFGGQVTGQYRRASNFTFSDSGERFERITYFPQPTLSEISFTQEDLEDLGGVQPFALEAAKINDYNFAFLGKERLDELDTYVFDVAPKVIPKKVSERFFKGRVWVDAQDLQIVKVRGKGVPEGDQRFPTFETYREQIDGKYWFPTYTSADDTLEFKGGQTVHLRMTVRYTDYKKYRGRLVVVEDEGIVGETQTTPETQATPGAPTTHGTQTTPGTHHP